MTDGNDIFAAMSPAPETRAETPQKTFVNRQSLQAAPATPLETEWGFAFEDGSASWTSQTRSPGMETGLFEWQSRRFSIMTEWWTTSGADEKLTRCVRVHIIAPDSPGLPFDSVSTLKDALEHLFHLLSVTKGSGDASKVELTTPHISYTLDRPDLILADTSLGPVKFVLEDKS